MRIGLIAPSWVPVPPPAYGGAEVVVDHMAHGLSRFGPEVELFTVGESSCPMIRHHLAERLELLEHADRLRAPIGWPEPFALTVIEAMAAGVPVLAFPAGAAPEILASGHAGFLCADEQGMIRAVAQLGLIDRAACRAEAERRFSLDRMAADHVRRYEAVLTGDRFRSRPQAVGHPALRHANVRRPTG